MPEIPPLGGGSFNLPSGIGPVLSYGRVRDVIDGAERYLNRIIDKIKRHLGDDINTSAQAGANAEVKVLQGLASKLTPPEDLLNELVLNVQNDLAGRIAPAIALLEALGHPYGDMPDMGKGLGQLPSSPPGEPRLTGDSTRFVSSGDASKGRSAGALSAKEQELGVDPVVVDSSSVTLSPTSVGVDYSAPPPGTVSGGVVPGGGAQVTSMSQRAQDWLAQCRAQGFGGCDPPYSVWSPPPGGAPDCAVVGAGSSLPGGWTPCPGSFASLDDALTAADACTAAGGVCPGSVPSPGPPSPPPLQPPTPIGSPPPPPPECCPPPVINVPPCPPPPSIPDCVKVEFCDWEKLCSTLRDCLPGAKPTEDCALDNSDAWVYKDCEGVFGSQLTEWLGDQLSGPTESDTLQGMVDGALAIAGVADTSAWGPLDFLAPPPPEQPV